MESLNLIYSLARCASSRWLGRQPDRAKVERKSVSEATGGNECLPCIYIHVCPNSYMYWKHLRNALKGLKCVIDEIDMYDSSESFAMLNMFSALQTVFTEEMMNNGQKTVCLQNILKYRSEDYLWPVG